MRSVLVVVLAVIFVCFGTSFVACDVEVIPGNLYSDIVFPSSLNNYTFSVTASVRQVVISAASVDNGDTPSIMVGFDYHPTILHNEDFSHSRPRLNRLQMLTADLVDWETKWVVTLEGAGASAMNYTFSVQLHDCLNGCSGHGVCVSATGECQCDASHRGADCSVQAEDMVLPAAVTGTVGPDGDWDIFRINVPQRYGAAARALYAALLSF